MYNITLKVNKSTPLYHRWSDIGLPPKLAGKTGESLISGSIYNGKQYDDEKIVSIDNREGYVYEDDIIILGKHKASSNDDPVF
jgi:hypothetical protein